MTNDQQRRRLAWFSPLPPARSGVAAYSAELLPRLQPSFVIDLYPEHAAHDFLWRARRTPYDLVVYQLGNAPCHDYMWAYLVSHPGLVVLHDARLHHARARQLLQHERVDDYRREFRYDHPDARPDFTEFAAVGLGRTIYYFWSMLRVVMRTARLVAVHHARVAHDLGEEYPGVALRPVRMGVPELDAPPDARNHVRRTLGVPEQAFVFAAFGKVTAEKRVAPILAALSTLVAEGRDPYLLLVGDGDGYPSLEDDVAARGLGDRVRVAGHVEDEAIGAYLAAADACLCLRWPTALETSASWLRCLAAGRATVISDLAHLADIPANVSLRVDLVDEDRTLADAMRRLMSDPRLVANLGEAGRRYWSANHTLDAMAGDYEQLIADAIARPAPTPPADLPRHFVEDYSGTAASIARRFGVEIDV